MPGRVSGAAILLPRELLDDLVRCRGEHLPFETGGFLMGLRRGPHIEITAATFQQAGDCATRSSFYRADPGHADLARELWDASQGKVGLVGDWHTHPSGSGGASATDRTAWQALSRAITSDVIGIVLAQCDPPVVYRYSHGRLWGRLSTLVLAERTARDLVYMDPKAAAPAERQMTIA